jgi:hypothetical protein
MLRHRTGGALSSLISARTSKPELSAGDGAVLRVRRVMIDCSLKTRSSNPSFCTLLFDRCRPLSVVYQRPLPWPRRGILEISSRGYRAVLRRDCGVGRRSAKSLHLTRGGLRCWCAASRYCACSPRDCTRVAVQLACRTIAIDPDTLPPQEVVLAAACSAECSFTPTAHTRTG